MKTKRFFLFSGVVTLLVMGAGTASASQATFPSGNAWVPISQGGVVLGDPRGDFQRSRDIVGDETHGAAFVARDATHMFFRLRVDDSPLQGSGDYQPFGWGVLFDIDADATTYEYLAMLNGIANPDVVELVKNTSTSTTNSPKDVAEQVLATWPTSEHAQATQADTSFGGDQDWFVDWAIEIQALVDDGFDPNTPIRFILGTSNSAHTVDADTISPSDATTLVDLGSDPIDCSGNNCVAGCNDDSDCTNANAPACQPDGSCGECSATNDALCSGNEQCHVQSGICGLTCTTDGDCSGAQPACQPSGVCGQCSASNDTACTGTTPNCDTTRGICVAEPIDPNASCTTDADCPAALPACQPSGVCGECSASNDSLCSGQCDTATGRCPGGGTGGPLGDDEIEAVGDGLSCAVSPSRGAGLAALALLGAGLVFAARRRRRR